MKYKYITENNLENIQTYMYSEYSGKSFLKAFFEVRKLKTSDKSLTNTVLLEYVNHLKVIYTTTNDLKNIISQIYDDIYDREMADKYIKAFEVRKRIYNEYLSNSIKPNEDMGYTGYCNYILLSCICILFYRKFKNLKYLNTLLKIDDSILSFYQFLSQQEKEIFGDIIKSELDIIEDVLISQEINGRW